MNLSYNALAMPLASKFFFLRDEVDEQICATSTNYYVHNSVSGCENCFDAQMVCQGFYTKSTYEMAHWTYIFYFICLENCGHFDEHKRKKREEKMGFFSPKKRKRKILVCPLLIGSSTWISTRLDSQSTWQAGIHKCCTTLNIEHFFFWFLFMHYYSQYSKLNSMDQMSIICFHQFCIDLVDVDDLPRTWDDVADAVVAV